MFSLINSFLRLKKLKKGWPYCQWQIHLLPITDYDVLVLYFKQGSTKDRVFAVYIYFTKHTDEEVCQKAITGLGTLINVGLNTGFVKSVVRYQSYLHNNSTLINQ